ncbi:2-polyprenyl-6-methoxyphenol hydroxylase-like FAD-dependent oxidoreductase [Promicromonospora sp. AC04]|uniref:FAD-dependent monooxygenase n=1 Tax=Promicromonospora sp. AC04 TaxID=2135723 RepID=UPI000D3864DB|nr:FAD-dependent monooxygenase [Promicromonospora sp. AC04]PUB20213.1 2-polyprenyl-6-methoxyphenol hydroxylase-like FAD-dependent oxidoreductase [Promicromonospora sp. AC04]
MSLAPKTTRRVLVVGLGIAGMSTAIRLRQSGWEPVIVERAPARRPGGHFIALFGTGRAAAQRLGVLDLIENRTNTDSHSWEVDRKGHKRPGLGSGSIPGAAPWILLRGDVEDGLYQGVPEDLEIRYSTQPVALDQDTDGVDVTLRDTAADHEYTERFDLVVGADGVRSAVRRLAFGPDANFVHPLGYMIATALLDSQITGIGEKDSLVLAEPGRSLWTFSFKNHEPSLMFSYRTTDPAAELARGPVESVRAAFGQPDPGPFLGEALERFAATDHTVFDSAQQVRMRQFHNGRVVLVGDSAWCMTLYSGYGASCGLAGGELLGTYLDKYPDDVPAALVAWNEHMHPHVSYQHQLVGRSRTLFTPHDRREQVMRTALIRTLNMPGVSGLARRRMQHHPTLSIKDRDIAILPDLSSTRDPSAGPDRALVGA